MKNYALTFIGLLLSILIFFVTIVFRLDLFELFIEFLHNFEHFEIDELILPIIVFSFFAFLDSIRRQRLKDVETGKLKIFKAMMTSMHHILNNFLNQMQLFKYEADRTPGFEPEVLDLYEKIMAEASKQIEELGNIPSITEASINESINPH